MVQLAFSQAVQHLHAVLQPVHEHLVVAIRLFFRDHRPDHAAAHRIETVDLRVRIAHGHVAAFMEIDPLFFQPERQFLKGQDRIHRAPHPVVPDSLLLLGDARAQEHNLYIRPVQLLYVAPVGDHGRHDRRHQRRALRIIFLDEIVHAGTACGDDIGHPPFPDQLLVLICHQGRAFRRLPDLAEPELLKRVHDLPRPVVIQHPRIGRGDGDNRPASLSQITFYPFHIAGKGLRILGTDLQASPAVDAVVYHDPGLLVPDTDGFHRTVADTFITMAAFGVFKINNLHPGILLFSVKNILSDAAGNIQMIFSNNLVFYGQK